MYESLFEPISIGQVTVENRFVMPAMNTHFGNKEHLLTEQGIRYYAERAKGGFGLIFTEYLCVSEEGLAYDQQLKIYDDDGQEAFEKLTEAVHANHARIFAQLQHSGRMQRPGVTSLPPVSASNIPYIHASAEVHELTTEETVKIEDKFAAAALRAQKSGFDGVEVQAGHGYLLSQFLSRSTNKRVDCYGGSITNRGRIVVNIIKKIKELCGEDYPISVRLNADDHEEDGNKVQDAAAFALLFEDAGADVLNVSFGTPIMPYQAPNGFNIGNVKAVKAAVDIPVIAVGRINDPTLALSVLKTGSADMVALGRQSICDPHFPEKVKHGEINEIFTCTGCMQRCLYSGSYEEGYGISCMINPFSGKEGDWEIRPAQKEKKIAIIGAGVSGLMAGWILGKRGYEVTIFEKEAVPGGQYRLAAIPSMKQDLAKTVSTYAALCRKYHVEIRYNTEATAERLEQEGYDEIIIASGSNPLIPRIEGIEGEKVCTAQDILRFKCMMNGKNVLILGAGLVGVETGEVLAGYHNQVTIVDMLDRPAPLAPMLPREYLLKNLEEKGIKFILGSKVAAILSDGIQYEKDGTLQKLTGFDHIVLAFGARADQRLYNDMKNPEKVHLIGDASRAKDAKADIFEAAQLALTL